MPLQVKQEVWDALLKRYGYQEVTDMLALMHSASVIRRAVRAMRQRKWTRKMAKIDPEMVEKVERLRKIQVQTGGENTKIITTAATVQFLGMQILIDAKLQAGASVLCFETFCTLRSGDV